MSTISLKAAPGLTGVTYKVENPSGTFSAAHTDAAEVQPGLYQAAEPNAYVGVYWSDGRGGTAYSVPQAAGGGSLDTAAVAGAIVTALLASDSVGTLDPSALATAAGLSTLQTAVSGVQTSVSGVQTSVSGVQTSVSSVVSAVAALPAAELGAAIITIPGDHTTSGNPVTLTHKQVIALEDAVRGGDNTTAGTPAANGTVTVTYYLRGQPKTTGNVVQESTVTYGAGGQQTGRVDKVASPFPSF